MANRLRSDGSHKNATRNRQGGFKYARKSSSGIYTSEERAKLTKQALEQRRFDKIQSAIKSSSLSKRLQIPSSLIHNVAEYSSGPYEKCDNFAYCGNRSINVCKSDAKVMVFDITISKICKDSTCSNGYFQSIAAKCVEQYGYFSIDEKYFCSKCVRLGFDIAIKNTKRSKITLRGYCGYRDSDESDDYF